MSVLDDAIMTDATGQDAVTELTGIKNALTRNATDIPFSPTASGLSQATVQGAINETARITSYAYDNTATYAKGRYCIHNGGLYKCTTAINTAEEWNAAHWTATTVEAELASTNNSLTQLLPNITLGTPVSIPWTNDTYTCTTAGIITGFVRKSNNSSEGALGIQSSIISNGFRIVKNLYSANQFTDVNMLVSKGEVLTLQNKTELSTINISFVPFA